MKPLTSFTDIPFGLPLEKPIKRRRDEAEFRLHCFVHDTLRRLALAGVIYFHPPNGEKRGLKTAARLKRMGVLPGVADWIIFVPWANGRAFFLELKRPGGTLSPAQKAFRDRVVWIGCAYEVARTGEEAIGILRAWGAIRKEARVA